MLHIISIHAPREGGDCSNLHMIHDCFMISIHAPREGGDRRRLGPSAAACSISIHAPREGGDENWWQRDGQICGFQSTPPARGATLLQSVKLAGTQHFNPRPPRGGRRDGGSRQLHQARISIHAPREGGDSKDAQFYLRIFDKQVELLRFLGKIRGWLPEKPGERPAFSREKPCEPPSNLWSLGLRGGGKARPGYPCAVPLPRRAACVRGSGDPPADRCSSYRNAPLFSHIASPGSKSADCLSQDP